MIATYALCSFSNLGTIGIAMGVLGGMAPSKRHVLARLVFRALICGCVCCLYTAALAVIQTGNRFTIALESHSVQAGLTIQATNLMPVESG
ncbi:hypothetical protein TELCIR_24368 [Teladorsagia circumcincta]|uniref:Concentrative nucleoside transporter C-terminal domain-containing protein n=1 Tax=Teladorsagia circumcincta TaxID=45464 RepID=A0A2G9T8I2_TELCI|nr:hypothetical protein TELCIR_24368 [Teladorsagia circumcincta]